MWWRQHLACTPQCHRLVENLEAARTRHKVDVTIRNPHASHLITTASKQQLHAANEGVKEKKQKYSAYIAEGERFFPLAMETFGGIHDQIREFVGLASWRVNNVAYDSNTYTAPTFSTYWLQRLSVTLWRENAKMVHLVAQRTRALRGEHGYHDDVEPAGTLAAVALLSSCQELLFDRVLRCTVCSAPS
eukprot:m.106000 g.106000  ORF g.106000 m.106000 type:complete len:189 (-) comp51669_c0_seq7:73-639(-)